MTTKTIIVTGAASGIGQHMAGVMANAGHQVVATDVNYAALQDHFAGFPNITCRRLDVRDRAAWESLFADYPQVDVLMNIAAMLVPAHIQDIEPDDIARHLEVNAQGVMLGTTLAAQQMVKRGAGHIINVASLAGVAPIAGLTLYSASKFAVRGFSLAAAMDLRGTGIAVTVICPDAVQTPMLDMQINQDAAALTFSGGKVYTVQDMEKAFWRALKSRAPEVLMPRSRGWLARISGALPGLAWRLEPFIRRRGQQNQQRVRAHRNTD